MTTTTVKPVLTLNDTKEAMLARIAELQAKEERKSKLANGLSLKYKEGTVKVIVSAKGGISFYGFNVRFPLSVYKAALLCILDNAPALREFIAKHDSELSQGKEE
jgi:hypothetical protein